MPPAKRSMSILPMATSASVTVGSRAAAAVAGGAGLGAGAVGPDLDALQGVDAGDRAAAGADLHHLDDGNAQRRAAALLEARLAVDLEGAALERLAVVDQADLGGGAAHVEGEDAALAALERDVSGQDGAAGRARLHQSHRELRGRLQAGEAAARGHQVDRPGVAELGEGALQAVQVARHQRLHVGVGDGGGGALVLAGLRADGRRQADADGRDTARPGWRRCAARARGWRRSGSAPRRSPRCPCRRCAWRPGARPPRRAARRTAPCTSRRSGTVKRSSRGTSGGVLTMLMSYWSKRLSSAISITSRKPSVAISAVLAPLRSMMALVASVVPCTNRPMSANARPAAAERAARAVDHGHLGRTRRGQHLADEAALAVEQDDVGKRAADVDSQPGCPALRAHGSSFVVRTYQTPRRRRPARGACRCHVRGRSFSRRGRCAAPRGCRAGSPPVPRWPGGRFRGCSRGSPWTAPGARSAR